MKTKFNKYERVAGIFVLAAALGGLATMFSVAYKKGWFSAKVPVVAIFESAGGIHVGTKVQMAGLRAGSVDSIELQSDNSIKIEISLLKKFFEKVKADSTVRVARPYVIGEKVIDIRVGSIQAESIQPGSVLAVERTLDLMDLMSSGEIGPYLNSLSSLAENLGLLVNALSDRERFVSLIEVIDELNPMVKNLNKMSQNVVVLSDQLNEKKRVKRLMVTLTELTDELQKHMPEIKAKGPAFAHSLNESVDNLALISEEMKKTLPALSAVAPDLPQTATRMVEAVNEMVVTLKALQKSWFFRSHVKEVMEEETKRVPANE